MYNNQNEKDMSVSYNSVDVFQYEGWNLKYDGQGIYDQNCEWVSFNAPQKKRLLERENMIIVMIKRTGEQRKILI
jgi:hypothetical protein